MIEQLQNLAQSQNVALIMSMIANVAMGWTIVRLFAKLEAGNRANQQLLAKLIGRQLEESDQCSKKSSSTGSA